MLIKTKIEQGFGTMNSDLITRFRVLFGAWGLGGYTILELQPGALINNASECIFQSFRLRECCMCCHAVSCVSPTFHAAMC